MEDYKGSNYMNRMQIRTALLVGLSLMCYPAHPLQAAIDGVAAGIPEPEHRNVIVQLFNWRFTDIKQVLPQLKAIGYSHVHVSPPQRSNESVLQCGGAGISQLTSRRLRVR